MPGFQWDDTRALCVAVVANTPPPTQQAPVQNNTTPVAPAPFTPSFTIGTTVASFTLGPTVTGFDPKAKTAVLTWRTDIPSTSDIIYGKRLDYSHELRETTPTTDHRLVLTGLTPGATHNVRVTAISATGEATATGDILFQFLKEGDRIKGSGPGIYWWKNGVKRPFPNPKTYLYWFKSWGGIITIGDAQLNWIPVGVPVRIGKQP